MAVNIGSLISDRSKKQRRIEMDTALARNLPLESVVKTTINGYRSLHLNQMYRQGMSSELKASGSHLVVGQNGSTTVGP